MNEWYFRTLWMKQSTHNQLIMNALFIKAQMNESKHECVWVASNWMNDFLKQITHSINEWIH